MKKRSSKNQVKNTAPKEDAENAQPVTAPMRAPTLPGSPLRLEEFPTLHEVARLSCILANGSLPSSPDAARRLAAAALEIWRGCRDELTSSRGRSSDYWQSRDESANRLTDSFEAVNAFLSENEGTHLIGADRVSWDEAIAVLSFATSKSAATDELERIVSTNLVGCEFFANWSLEHFKELGFNPLSFPTLILSVAEERERQAAAERSAAMSKLGQLSVEKRQAKKETEKWGRLATGKENRTSRKKST